MSYDIDLLLLKPGESASEAYHDNDVDDEPYSAEAKQRNAQIVAALVAHYPDLETFESDHHIELHTRSATMGLQISFFNSSGTIALPYWPNHDATRVLKIVGDVLRIILKNSTFAAFDPQNDDELTLQTDIVRSIGASYAIGSAYAMGSATSTSRIVKKPWWRWW